MIWAGELIGGKYRRPYGAVAQLHVIIWCGLGSVAKLICGCCLMATVRFSGCLPPFGSIEMVVSVSCVGLNCDLSLVSGNAVFLMDWLDGELGDSGEEDVVVDRTPLFASAS